MRGLERNHDGEATEPAWADSSAPPGVRVRADYAAEHPREMALIEKTAGKRDARERLARRDQQLFGFLDAPSHQPLMGRVTHRNLERAAQAADRHFTSLGD